MNVPIWEISFSVSDGRDDDNLHRDHFPNQRRFGEQGGANRLSAKYQMDSPTWSHNDLLEVLARRLNSRVHFVLSVFHTASVCTQHGAWGFDFPSQMLRRYKNKSFERHVAWNCSTCKIHRRRQSVDFNKHVSGASKKNTNGSSGGAVDVLTVKITEMSTTLVAVLNTITTLKQL